MTVRLVWALLVVLAVVVVVVSPTQTTTCSAFLSTASLQRQRRLQHNYDERHEVAVTTTKVADDFSSFEASLVEEEEEDKKKSSDKKRKWQDTLELFLDPTTPVNQRQGLFTDLLSANQDIRSSVESAIRDRSIDPLLTPRGKRLQEGSRAVARQITSDILPELIQPQSKQSSSSSVVPPVQDIQKVGNRIFNALQTRFQRDMEAMQSDIQNDPLRSIPQRISKQSQQLLREAQNVFAETPAGLQELPYTLVSSTSDYEIRDYQGYTVASTNMAPVGSDYDDSHSLAQNGVALNTLAAYVFGANKQGLAMEMTTPITTTMSGEMRLYLPTTSSSSPPPEPLEQDESNMGGYDDQPGRIWIQQIPPARLAVRRFTGFCTKGEVTRQKQALLASLAMDDDVVELDVPHGSTVPHVVFQYNPPYTIPVVRRNEIAVAVASSKPASSPNGSSSSSANNNNNNNSKEDLDGVSTSIRDSWEPVE